MESYNMLSCKGLIKIIGSAPCSENDIPRITPYLSCVFQYHPKSAVITHRNSCLESTAIVKNRHYNQLLKG